MPRIHSNCLQHTSNICFGRYFAGVPAVKFSNELHFESHLSKDQQVAQYVPLENKTSLRNTRSLPQQIPRTQKRSRSPVLPLARSAPSLSSSPDLRASSSKNNERVENWSYPSKSREDLPEWRVGCAMDLSPLNLSDATRCYS